MIPSALLKQKKNILISVLNWGLGHATRMIPLINLCIANGSKVVICSDGIALDYLSKAFPKLIFEKLPSYNIKYSARFNSLNLAIQFWKIPVAIHQEHKVISSIINKYTIDLIISDNRYGCYNDQIDSVLVTHQTHLFAGKWYNFIPNNYLQRRLNKFSEIWIPDDEARSLSGELSKHSHKHSRYIGPLSRLIRKNVSKTTDILILLSGIEPQRSLLEKLLLDLKLKERYSLKWIRGTDKYWTYKQDKPKELLEIAHQEILNKWVNESKVVICRSGYSSIMDLVALEQQAILVPTPGQQEQMYLAKHLNDHRLFKIIEQKSIQKNLEKVLSEMLENDNFAQTEAIS